MDKAPKTIAMLTTWLDGWYQSQLWRGAVAAARTHGCRLLTLVGYARPESIMPSGPESIMGVVGRAQIDGVIMSSGPLSFWEGPEALQKILAWLPSRTTVSLGLTISGVDSVVPEGGGIGDLVRHMIQVHACRRIAFLAGPPLNPDAKRRLKDYREALLTAGIPFDPQLVEVGGFYLEGGMQAMELILASGARFDAVVAANDAMAIGAAKVLHEHGLRIPEDVRISGYDDTQEGRYQQPPLTTVANPTHQIAYRGLEMCLDRIESPQRAHSQDIVPVGVCIRKSCGCMDHSYGRTHLQDTSDSAAFAEAWHLLQNTENLRHDEFLHWIYERLEEGLDYSIDDIAQVLEQLVIEIPKSCPPTQMPKVYEQIYRAQQMITEASQAQLCARMLNQDGLVRDLHRTSNALLAHSDPDLMIERLAECSQDWCPEGIRLFLIHKDFSPAEPADLMTQQFEYRAEIRYGKTYLLADDDDLLPKEVVPGEIWIGVPIEQGAQRFGVVLFRNWDRNESFVEHLRIVFTTAFSLSWQTRFENRMRETLHRLSIRDELTSLYNRRGLFEVANILTNQAIRERKMIGVIYVDMDRLKEINDTYGHADGDLAICTLSDALRVCFRGSDVLARLGGDEFAAVFILNDAGEHMILLSRLHSILQESSSKLQKPWKVSASVGWSVWDPSDGSSLEKEMLKADQNLYADKANKKRLGLR